MPVKITVLYDNRCDDRSLQEGWGFSALIEHDGSKILFDTGGDPAAFLSNLERKQLSLNAVTHLVFSHRHWDHIAGFKEIAERVGDDTSLYVPKTFPWFLLKSSSSRFAQAKIVRTFEEITPNVYALVLRGGFWLYELSLVTKTPQGLGVITGCAHPGIIHILKEAQEHLQSDINFVLGGFHLLFSPATKCRDIVNQLQALNVQKVAPCHCSGDHLIRMLQDAYGSNFSKVGTGSVLTF